MASYFGTSGDDHILGTGDADTIYAGSGGIDKITAGGGNDSIQMGSGLTADDRIDGGEGTDFVFLSGDYSHGLTLQAKTIQNVEFIEFAQGNSYDLRSDDGNVAAHGELIIASDYLNADDRISFDGSAERDGHFQFWVGSAVSTMIGGAGDDLFYADDALSGFDVLDGRGGDDTLHLDGYRQKVFDFAGNHVMNIEHIVVDGDSASLILTDDVVQYWTMRIDAGASTALTFDGSAETSSSYIVTGGDLADDLQTGAGFDSLIGGDGDDRLTGHGAADDLRGGDGADTFAYVRTADSKVKAPDVIHDLTADDVIDLSAIDAKTGKAGDQAFHLVSAFDGHAGEIMLHYDPVSAQTQLSLDVDGDGRAEAMILIDGDHRDFTNFVLKEGSGAFQRRPVLSAPWPCRSPAPRRRRRPRSARRP
jgi:Ca2+-binding RTX toxin-like protein